MKGQAYAAAIAASVAISALAATDELPLPHLGELKPALAGAELLPRADITLTEAEITALRVRPGSIKARELQKEKSGGGLRYTFTVTDRGKDYEVGVDARTGKVVENRLEGKKAD